MRLNQSQIDAAIVKYEVQYAQDVPPIVSAEQLLSALDSLVDDFSEDPTNYTVPLDDVTNAAIYKAVAPQLEAINFADLAAILPEVTPQQLTWLLNYVDYVISVAVANS